jgi:flagellar hook-length control protein FliK
VDPVLQAGTASLPSQTAASAAVLHSTPQLPQLANAQAPASELQPLEPASLARPGSRPVKAASPPPPPAGPDAAVLERAAEILRQIQLHATPHVRRLTLELEPAELGRLSVQLALRTGRVAAIVRGENPETLALLEQHEAGLRDVLAQRGIAADAVRFELGFGGQRSRRGAGAPSPVQSTSSSSATTSSSTPPREHASRIDLVA